MCSYNFYYFVSYPQFLLEAADRVSDSRSGSSAAVRSQAVYAGQSEEVDWLI